jgi:adenosylcobalamin-dependent ribonucleoside-triphosphate reductase
MSNNSIAFTQKPERKILQFIFQMMRLEGEPGFINLEEAARRRLKRGGVKKPSKDLLDHTMMMIGLNPCAEILLWSKGVCNLTTINCPAFVKDGILDTTALFEAQRMSVRAGLRMTLVQLELQNWDGVQKRDRLLGNSVTGWQDMLDNIDYEQFQGAGSTRESTELYLLKHMGKIAEEEAAAYASRLRVTKPLLDTTVKPEGTISQVCGSVSPGLHRSKGRHYIRHIRISALDPLAKAVQAMGWKVHPEVGTPGGTYEEQMQNARTFVVAFPVSTGAKTTEADVTVDDQFDTYFNFQKHYTSHNSSNTITIKDPAAWDRAEQRVWGGWNDFVGVSFLALDGGTYQLAPYQVISKEEYVQAASDMTPFNTMILEGFENGTLSDLSDDSCATGACPIR